MPEVLEIRMPDQLRLPRPERPPRRPHRWRPFAGLVLIATLTIAAVVAVTGPRERSVANVPVSVPATSSVPRPPVDPVLTAVADAVDAWERFGSSGDLAAVAGPFDEGGPQFRRFRDEAEALRRRPATDLRLQLRSSLRRQTPDGPVVDAKVEMFRGDSEPVTLSWEYVLRQKGATWTVWTVRGSGLELPR